MKDGFWVIRSYQAGQVGEKIKYWVEGARPTKSERRLKADIKKQQQNEASAEKNLARLLNENFHKGDILLGLDYSDVGLKQLERRSEEIASKRALDGDGYEEAAAEQEECRCFSAQREAMNFIRRVKRECDKQGIAVRYIVTTSDMDGETGEAVRVHHHIVINAEALEACRLKWPHGSVEWEYLSGQPDYTPIAAYLLRQVRHVPDAKKYAPSRNLVRPQPKDRIAIGGSELRVPKGCALLHRNEYNPGRPQYIRYILSPYRE